MVRAVATAKRVFVWLNGTVQAFADCEAGRFDAATKTRLVKYAAAGGARSPTLPPPTYSDVLLEELPALGTPDAPCGGGGAAAAAAAPPSAARAPRAAAAAAAAALLAGLAAL